MKKEHDTLNGVKVDAVDLKSVFVSYLNRVYCGKTHLIKNLPEIAHQAVFSDLKYAIEETRDDVEKQLSRMMRIYQLIDAQVTEDSCLGLHELVDQTFCAITNAADNEVIRDMSILFYMQNIESIEVTSYQILHIIAGKLYGKEIKQLLKENFDEANEDKTLLLLILSKYID